MRMRIGHRTAAVALTLCLAVALTLCLAVALAACSGTVLSPTAGASPTAAPTGPQTQTPTASAATPTPTTPAGLTSTPAPTASPAPTAAKTPTPTPALLTLPAWVMDCIGIGSNVSSLFGLANDNAWGGETPAMIRLSNGRTVAFEYSGTGFSATIVRYQISGSAAVVPKPDAKPVADFQVAPHGFVLAPLADVRPADLIAALGAPIDDTTVLVAVEGDYSDPESLGMVYQRILRYPGLVVALAQSLGIEDKTNWYVRSFAVTSPAYPTPRGLRTGMTVRAILDLFGTGAFMIESRGRQYTDPGIQRLTIDSHDGYRIRIDLLDGVAARITMEGPGDN